MENSLFPYVDKVEALRRRDERMAQLIDRFGYIDRPTDAPLFETFVESIASQQVSLAATRNVMARLTDAAGEITPVAVAALPVDKLKSCGLSERKAQWLKAAAEQFAKGRFDKERLATMSDDEITADLIALDGVGVWTAEMLMIFSLGRENILSEKDLIIRRALQTLYGIKRLTAKRFDRYRKLFSPYCTIASFYLWAYGNSLPKYSPEVTIRRLDFKKLKNKTLHYSFVRTANGDMLLASVSSGVCWFDFADDCGEALAKLRGEFPRAELVEERDKFQTDFLRAFELRSSAPFRLSLQGTPFELKVWRELTRIPRGVTVSYSYITSRTGFAKACRAVGNAVGANPVVIVVPCHRVIRSDGEVGGFTGGIDKKLALLQTERN